MQPESKAHNQLRHIDIISLLMQAFEKHKRFSNPILRYQVATVFAGITQLYLDQQELIEIQEVEEDVSFSKDKSDSMLYLEQNVIADILMAQKEWL